MAARLLAAALEMDLYRLDLASVVNKYIGETEKSLEQLFSRAEELDVILLIDEGDALLTGRTAVQTSTTATPTSKRTTCYSASKRTRAS